jgi:hypothetical protein
MSLRSLVQGHSDLDEQAPLLLFPLPLLLHSHLVRPTPSQIPFGAYGVAGAWCSVSNFHPAMRAVRELIPLWGALALPCYCW